MSKQSMHIALLGIEIFIPHAQSLKAKRAVIKSLLAKLKAEFNASIAELGYHDQWQRSLIGVCMLAGNKRYLEGEIARVEQKCLESGDFQVMKISKDWL
jgi:uncharacterized protein YlxP (DUF503 family)